MFEQSLKGKTAIVTGASRGIGKAIALKFGAHSANVVVASKTESPHATLPGTIGETVEEVQTIGSRALAVQVDIRDEDQIKCLIDKTVNEFGGVDILVNNAGAVNLSGIEEISSKRFDLLHSVNSRAPFLISQCCLPYLKKATNPHILNVSPPLDNIVKWLSRHSPYTISKYSMTMWALGMAQEFKKYNISVNCLWPKYLIATSALEFLTGSKEIFSRSRKPEIMADAACEIVKTEKQRLTGACLLDEEILIEAGIHDFTSYAYAPEQSGNLQLDAFLEN